MSKPFLREIGSALFASIHLFVEAFRSVLNLFLISLCWSRNILYEPADEPQSRKDGNIEHNSVHLRRRIVIFISMWKLQWDRGLRYDYSLRNLKWAAKAEKKKKRNDKRLCVIFIVAWINVNIEAMSQRGVIPPVVKLLLHVKGF